MFIHLKSHEFIHTCVIPACHRWIHWRPVVDFPQGVRQLPKVLLFFNFFPENCMKMKEFGPPGVARVPGAPTLRPPMKASEMRAPLLPIFFNLMQFSVKTTHIIESTLKA